MIYIALVKSIINYGICICGLAFKSYLYQLSITNYYKLLRIILNNPRLYSVSFLNKLLLFYLFKRGPKRPVAHKFLIK